jgi:hypothetical protein
VGTVSRKSELLVEVKGCKGSGPAAVWSGGGCAPQILDRRFEVLKIFRELPKLYTQNNTCHQYLKYVAISLQEYVFHCTTGKS